MAPEFRRWFKAGPLTFDQRNRIEDARRAAEKHLEQDAMSDMDLLMLLVNDTAPSWRKGK